MEGQQARSRFCRWSSQVLPLVVALFGLALIAIALQPPATQFPVPSRQAAASYSSRGQHIAGRQWRSLEEQTVTAEAMAATPTPPAETPVPLLTMGVGGPPELSASVGETQAITVEVEPSPTPIPPRTEVLEYTVEPGDNVFLISQKFLVSQDTIIWANDRLEMDPDLLSIGQVLRILPVTGVEHTVKAGDTLAGIAKRYKVEPQVILDYAPNGLHEPVVLEAGQKLIIPGGTKPFEPHLVYTEGGLMTVNARPEPGRFIWPCKGYITQYFGKKHLGIDIANNAGTPLYAADTGTVTEAGPHGGLGLAVFIDHGNGYVTWYGHMQRILVEVGQQVARGQQIGEMGSTGNSTGPHVHFVIRFHGGAVNPVRYLPG